MSNHLKSQHVYQITAFLFNRFFTEIEDIKWLIMGYGKKRFRGIKHQDGYQDRLLIAK
ncbi:MAG: hypothetical protein ISS59_05455 [Desulfobacteraceae bacterium]|nr:hypothetical protein [Desulfobacteraceae bacterium]